MVAHCLILMGLLVQIYLVRDRPTERAFVVSLLFAPLIRILSLALPLADFPLLYWYLIISIPLFLALGRAARSLDLSWREMGMHLRGWPLQLAIALSGLLFGVVEYLILRPEPLVPEFTLAAVWWPALVLLICTGLLEEMIFRGLLQRTGREPLGRWNMPYVSVLFAVLHIGYKSVADLLFVLAAGWFFGWVVRRTRSLLGVTLAHGLTNIVLFLVMPFLVLSPDGGGDPLLPAGVTAPRHAASTRTATTDDGRMDDRGGAVTVESSATSTATATAILRPSPLSSPTLRSTATPEPTGDPDVPRVVMTTDWDYQP
jgi:hypothetical protein